MRMRTSEDEFAMVSHAEAKCRRNINHSGERQQGERYRGRGNKGRGYVESATRES